MASHRPLLRPPDDTGSDHEFRRGWAAALACLIGHTVGLHTLPPYTSGLFVAPLQEAFGWSRTSISLGITILTMGTAIGAPMVGLLIERLGERLLIGAGMVVLAAGYAGLSMMQGSLAVFWVTMALMALLGAGCSPVTLSRILVGLFDRRRGAAVGITLVGTGLTGTLAPVLLAPVIATHGWRYGYLALALTMIVCLPIVLLLLAHGRAGAPHRKAADISRPGGERLVDIVRQPVFARLAATFFCIAIGTGGVVVHFVPMLIDAGYSAATAARMAGFLGLALVVARLLMGIAMDFVFAPRLAAVLIAASALGFAALTGAGDDFLPLLIVLVGLSLGVEIDLIVFLTSRYFPMAQYARAFGLLYSVFLIGVALSPVAYALIHERDDHYGLAFGGTAVFLAISAVLLASAPRFPLPRDRSALAEPARTSPAR